jgi:hypothetical protein
MVLFFLLISFVLLTQRPQSLEQPMNLLPQTFSVPLQPSVNPIEYFMQYVKPNPDIKYSMQLIEPDLMTLPRPVEISPPLPLQLPDSLNR